MKPIRFTKYSSCGNNFVIVDATETTILAESELAEFARRATNCAFGIGCDNLLVIQRCDRDTLAAIAAEHGYWESLPDADRADFIFRMFEPDGDEALCCGNGLICIADHLHTEHGINNARIMTEVPLSRPGFRRVGRAAIGAGSWANMGRPRRIPACLLGYGAEHTCSPSIDFINEISIPLPSHELRSYTNAGELSISGYLVFTGEPHLVIFPDLNFSVPALTEVIFESAAAREAFAVLDPGQPDPGSRLVHCIGAYINHQCRQLFPAGLNVNFSRCIDAAVLENRCFERGINRETLACGTGALAAAYVAQQVYGIPSNVFDVLPHCCRWHDPEARIRVHDSGSGWSLSSIPKRIYEGVYRLDSRSAPTRSPSAKPYSPVALAPCRGERALPLPQRTGALGS